MGPKAKAKSKSKLIKKVSDVHAFDSSGNVFKGFQVWVRLNEDAEDGSMFHKGLVLPGSTPDATKVKIVEPATDEEMTITANDMFNVNGEDPFSFSDIGMLPHQNVPCVLDFLAQRLYGKQIYSTADPLLVAMNPFRDIGVAGKEHIERYRDIADVTQIPPHVYTIARNALESLHMVRKSQTIIVSGESGAGKTEATKQVMQYFAQPKGASIDTRIQEAVLAANPVLEAFGNAKTLRNNNSSRFGRFMMLQVAAGGGIQYGTVRNFLLEKSRILTQEKAERNYHIFYQLLKGADADLRSKVMLKDLKSYKFVNPECPDAPNIDDVKEFNDVDEALVKMGLSAEEKLAVYSIVSGVMLMGNTNIVAKEADGVPDAAAIDDASRQGFTDACKLLYLDPTATEEGICIKMTYAGGQAIRGRWNQQNGQMLKDSLCKAMYEKLFFWLVVKLNSNIEPEGEWKLFMAMLDIFGFEVFDSNSLEQLFINITNEMLQKNFTDVVFEKETKLYKDEGISAADLKWTTNAEVIKLLTAAKGASVMTSLNEQCSLGSGTDEKFLSAAYASLKDNPLLIKPKMGNNVKFIVQHTVGEIEYDVVGFLFKNKDILRAELVEVIQASENSVSRALFEGVAVVKGKIDTNFIGSQFMKQLDELMALINQTEPHFVRCVKSNEKKQPLCFDQAKVWGQLTALSILEALQLRTLGYSYRRPFEDFLYQFRFIDLGIAEDSSRDAKERSQALMKAAGVDKGWQCGKTMMFLFADVAKDLVNKMRAAMAAWEPLCAKIEAMYLRKVYKDMVEKLDDSAVRFQALCRKKLVGKVKAPPPGQEVRGW